MDKAWESSTLGNQDDPQDLGAPLHQVRVLAAILTGTEVEGDGQKSVAPSAILTPNTASEEHNPQNAKRVPLPDQFPRGVRRAHEPLAHLSRMPSHELRNLLHEGHEGEDDADVVWPQAVA